MLQVNENDGHQDRGDNERHTEGDPDHKSEIHIALVKFVGVFHTPEEDHKRGGCARTILRENHFLHFFYNRAWPGYVELRIPLVSLLLFISRLFIIICFQFRYLFTVDSLIFKENPVKLRLYPCLCFA